MTTIALDAGRLDAGITDERHKEKPSKQAQGFSRRPNEGTTERQNPSTNEARGQTVRKYDHKGNKLVAPRLRQALYSDGNKCILYAVSDNLNRYPMSVPLDWHKAQAFWQLMDDMRYYKTDELRPLPDGAPVRFFAVRAADDANWPREAALVA